MWAQLKPLPVVAPWNKGQRTYTWRQRAADYAALEKRPLLITAELVTPIIHAEQSLTHLDSVLSSAAITDHPHPSSYDKVAVVPLPLDLLWVSPGGQPLWACTPLRPADAVLDAREYWHKCYPSQRAELGNKLSANTSAGRWREYRVPVFSQHTHRLHALAIGHADEIERLLGYITHLGKKGAMGYGRVGRWQVTPVDNTLDDILAQRPVPTACPLSAALSGPVASQRGWSPPYWYAPYWADCRVPA